MRKKIEINKAIYPYIMSIYLETKNGAENDMFTVQGNNRFDVSLDLPRDAFLMYLQNTVDEKNKKEMDLLEKYAYGIQMSDAEYTDLISLIMTPVIRNWSMNINGDILTQFGLCLTSDENGKTTVKIIEEAKEMLRAEAWEGILLDMLDGSAKAVISLFDFEQFFERKNANTSGKNELQFYLGAWKFTADEAEQKLSTALRSAFMYTLVGYYCGDRKNQYNCFQQYFEDEYYKRVSLVYGIWSSLTDKTGIKYVPLYDSFHNLQRMNKTDLIKILKAILDNPSVDIDDKEVLKNQLIESAGILHTNISQNDLQLEQNLIKPAVNFIILRDKAKKRLNAAKTLEQNGQYNDCANRCYYAMMDALKCLLEYKGRLSQWKKTNLRSLRLIKN
ncbi:HEPN domain-containing protein [Lachnospira multipara]|uniref:HEPN domain-containing protein n=1 Tax=Lachnospira multipara TaxID=28051 RepID=UPI000481F763|nr:HEPN domain-containing protein [Lachnospira multipara]